MTAVMISLALDMTEHRTHDRVSYVLNQHTAGRAVVMSQDIGNT